MSREKNTGGGFKNGWLRDAALIAVAFAIGWWGHTTHPVRAQSSNLYFQLQGIGHGAALALYYPDQQTIYLYPNAMAGYSKLNCAYQFKVGEPGGPVDRQQCKVPSFQP